MPGTGQPSPRSGKVIGSADTIATASIGTPACRAASATTGSRIEAGSAMADLSTGGGAVLADGPSSFNPAGDPDQGVTVRTWTTWVVPAVTSDVIEATDR